MMTYKIQNTNERFNFFNLSDQKNVDNEDLIFDICTGNTAIWETMRVRVSVRITRVVGDAKITKIN